MPISRIWRQESFAPVDQLSCYWYLSSSESSRLLALERVRSVEGAGEPYFSAESQRTGHS